MSIIKKQIKDFDYNPSPEGSDQLILQTQAGTTQKTTKTALLNEVNSSLVGLQTQIDNISISGSSNAISVNFDSTNTIINAFNVQHAIEQLDNVINGITFTELRGKEPCIEGQQIYSISYGSTISGGSELAPIVSLVIPSDTETMYVQGIFDITNTGFKVLISDPPTKTGYFINWSVNNAPVVNNFLTLTDTPSSYTDVDNYVVTVSGNSLVFKNPDELKPSGGNVELDIDQKIYRIIDQRVNDNSSPICSLVIPISGSYIPSWGIFNVQNGSFDVELNMAPDVIGYKLNWLII